MQGKKSKPMSRRRYRELRKSLGTQAVVAKRLGIAQNTLSRREIGTLPINREAEIAIECLSKH